MKYCKQPCHNMISRDLGHFVILFPIYQFYIPGSLPKGLPKADPPGMAHFSPDPVQNQRVAHLAGSSVKSRGQNKCVSNQQDNCLVTLYGTAKKLGNMLVSPSKFSGRLIYNWWFQSTRRCRGGSCHSSIQLHPSVYPTGC